MWHGLSSQLRGLQLLRLNTKVFENYCRDPFDKDNYTKFVVELDVPCMINNRNDVAENWEQDDTVQLRPQFVVSYDSMEIDAEL